MRAIGRRACPPACVWPPQSLSVSGLALLAQLICAQQQQRPSLFSIASRFLQHAFLRALFLFVFLGIRCTTVQPPKPPFFFHSAASGLIGGCQAFAVPFLFSITMSIMCLAGVYDEAGVTEHRNVCDAC